MIYYQNDSWIFATSTCNLENQNCTFVPFCAKNHWPTTQFLVHFIQMSLGRPTIRSVVDRPGKNFSIILTNHGHFGLFSASLKFERGRPRWILSDSGSTWKIQIVSKKLISWAKCQFVRRFLLCEFLLFAQSHDGRKKCQIIGNKLCL